MAIRTMTGSTESTTPNQFAFADVAGANEGMDQLRDLYIIHNSGGCLYYHQFTQGEALDPRFISDLLAAVLSVPKNRLVRKDASLDVKELVYKEYRILFKATWPCMFVILFLGQATNAIKAKLTQFADYFLRTHDNVLLFKDAENDVQSVFDFTKV